MDALWWVLLALLALLFVLTAYAAWSEIVWRSGVHHAMRHARAVRRSREHTRREPYED